MTTQLTDGSPVPEDRSHTALRPDGQQKGYVVLSPSERAKGFVKPVRHGYVHVGPPAPGSLRDLTPAEAAEYGRFRYAKYEEYPPERSPLCGKYWTQAELDRVAKRCGSVTTMGNALAETYARNPHFYSGTFCCRCSAHFDLNEFTWEPDGEPMDPRLQDAWHVEQSAAAAAKHLAECAALEQRERSDLTRLKAKYEPGG